MLVLKKNPDARVLDQRLDSPVRAESDCGERLS